MATKEELLEKNKSELDEMARERDLKGRSGMSKDELAEALAEGSSEEGEGAVERGDAELVDEEAAEDLAERDAQQEDRESRLEAMGEAAEEATDEDDTQEAGGKPLASTPEVAEKGMTGKDAEAFEEMSDAELEGTDLAMVARGPLHLTPPHERYMTGAINEEHAKAQEEALANMPDDFVGDVTEAGFDDEGRVVTDESDEKRKRREERFSKKENLGEGDDREIYEVYQEDVIDFPEPQGEEGEAETVEMRSVTGSVGGNSIVAGSNRGWGQKSVFYTDGLSGTADSNLERSYELPEVLQSNDPEERAAGDESLSEAAKEARSEEDERRAKETVERDDDPRGTEHLKNQ